MALDSDPSQVRTRTELILKTVSIHAAVLIAAGHLTTLRRVSRRSRKAAYWQLAWFFVVPTLPVAEILDRLAGCVRLAWRYGRRHGDASYYISAVFGMQTTIDSAGDDSDSTPLLEADYHGLQRVSQDRDLVWLGRLAVLFLFVVQAVATLVLFGRRIRQGEVGELDLRNALVALGGLLIQIQSIGILLMNYTWSYVGGRTLQVQSHENNYGVFLSLCLTFFLQLNSFYFRNHVVNTYNRFLNRKRTSIVDLYNYDRYFPYYGPTSETAYFRMLGFMWPIWVFLLFRGISQSHITVCIAAYLSLSFPIEEAIRGQFPTWVDPLSQKLFVF